MADGRRKTPNILDDLLGGGSPAQEPESQPSASTEGQKARTTEAQKARRPSSHKSVGTEAQKESNTEVQTSVSTDIQKIKTTFLFSRLAIARLEACWYEMRLSSGRKDISRSQIIEQALEMALDEYEKAKQQSRLSQALLSQEEKP